MEKNFLRAFSYKIKTPNELNKILKKNKVQKILCHGNFDVVHPGHIRHLLYAKSKADILIVSITADRFIKKGMYRPHIPQNLRALNLAAFEMVDFVTIHKQNPLLFFEPSFDSFKCRMLFIDIYISSFFFNQVT